jgi:hypothetical protein
MSKNAARWAPGPQPSSSPVPNKQSTHDKPSDSDDDHSSGKRSPYRVSESQTSTADPQKVSMYEGTSTPTL